MAPPRADFEDGMKQRAKTERNGAVPTAYFLMLLLFGLAALVPDLRLWGCGSWAFLPRWATGLLFFAGLIAGVAALRLPVIGRIAGRVESLPGNERSYLLVATGGALFLTALFWWFSSTTHFLGDGYQLLSRLTGGTMMTKSWDTGASVLMSGLYGVLAGPPQERALQAYQLVSILSGLLFVVAAALSARWLFQDTQRRVLFSLGLCGGGYTLMFFGYVENYALFIVAVLTFCLLGLLALRDRISRWWTILPVVVASALHIFGLLLLPGLIYLLAHDTPLGFGVGNLRPRQKVTLGVVLLILAVVAYYFLYSSFRFFTFALLPLLPDRFTVEGDYLVSFKHLVDVGNLLLLLLPGLPLLAVVLLGKATRSYWQESEPRFLLITFVSSLAAVYVFNPGIGMPRNWDLFAVVGVPLAVLGYYGVLHGAVRGRATILAVLLAIVLGGLSLGPRVAAQRIPEIGIATFKNYLTLDKIRNRNARSLLVTYYRETGDSARAEAVQAAAEADFPESQLNKRARGLIAQQQYREAAQLLQKAIAINPLYSDGYANLGVCVLETGHGDSALQLFDLADGINPYNVNTINNIGTAWLRRKEYNKARTMFERSLIIDSTATSSLVGMASVMVGLNDFEASIRFVDRLAGYDEIPATYFQQAGNAFAERGAYSQAARAFAHALAKGMDSTAFREVRAKYPQLESTP